MTDTPPAIVSINPSELGTPSGYSQVVEVSAPPHDLHRRGRPRSIPTAMSSAAMTSRRGRIRFFHP